MRTEFAHRDLVPAVETAREKWSLRTTAAVVIVFCAVAWLLFFKVLAALIFAPDAVIHHISQFVSHRGE
jgi:hypothetical protein